MKKLMKYLMSLLIKKKKQYINNILGIGASLNGGHRPLYPFFGKSQAWMKIFLLQPNIDKNKRIVYYGEYE